MNKRASLVVMDNKDNDLDNNLLRPTAPINSTVTVLLSETEESVVATSVSSSASSSTTGTEEEEEGSQFLEQDNDIAETNAAGTAVKEACTSALKSAQCQPTALSESSATSATNAFSAASAVTMQSCVQRETRTGIVHEAGAGHFDRSNRLHKERMERVLSIVEALENDTLLDRCHSLGSEPAAVDFLEDQDYLRVHLPGYMQRLSNFANCSCKQLDCEAAQYESIFLTDQSTLEAKRAAASLCTLVSQVVKGKLDNGFAVIRPPGHHAEPGLAGGYCLINNVAVAAAFARARLGVQKVLIVDWDIHHGNGTQSIFWNDPNVMYFSVHRWHGGNFYPFLPHGGPMAVGGGAGTGYNVNVGWTRKGIGDEEYFAVWERLLMPMAREFQPDLVLVSSGFDGAAGDMGECEVSPECFHLLTAALLSLAKGRVVCALEGGYVRSVLQSCVKAVVRALLDPSSPQKYEQCESDALQERKGVDILEAIDCSAAKSIRATQKAHSLYWKCLIG